MFGTDLSINEHLRTNRRGIQAGADYNFGGGVVGLTGGWQKAKCRPRRFGRRSQSHGLERLAPTASFGSATGFYGGLLVKYDANKLELDNVAFDGLGNLDSHELGHRRRRGLPHAGRHAR